MSYTRCTYCGSRLHTVANCPKTWGGSSRRANLSCGYCGQSGHNSNARPRNATVGPRRTLNDDFHLDWLHLKSFQMKPLITK